MVITGWLLLRPLPECGGKETRPTEGAEEYNYFVGALFPHTQAKIMDYNRVVKGLKGLSEEELIRRIESNFDVTPDFKAKSPSKPHEFGMYLKGKWRRLRMKEEGIGQRELIEKLDVWLLQNQLLSPVLGIQDPTTDKRIKFIGGIRGVAELERLVNSGEFDVAFSMYPPALKDLMDICGCRSNHAAQIDVVRTEVAERDFCPPPGQLKAEGGPSPVSCQVRGL